MLQKYRGGREKRLFDVRWHETSLLYEEVRKVSVECRLVKPDCCGLRIELRGQVVMDAGQDKAFS